MPAWASCAGPPGSFADINGLRQEADLVERVGDPLLLREYVGRDRRHAIADPRQCYFEHGCRDPDPRSEETCDLGLVVGGPAIGGIELLENRSDEAGVPRRQVLRGKEELVVVDEALTVDERPRSGGGLGCGQERVPDHPGVDST